MNKKCETNSVAPFVRKTYELVSNPMTDDIVVWGIHNNSFIIFDPMFFSQQVLPAYFKHNNFTSYIRQLNDYGFRKIDPDRWEFANQWFLRGQEELLCNITRKLKCSKNVVSGFNKRELEMDDEQQELRVEVSRLKEKQRQLEEELHRMSRRIEAIETRLEPMMSRLLYKADRPQLLINDGTMLLNGNNKQLMHYNNSDSISSTPCFYNYSTSMAVSSEEEDNWAVGSTNNEVDNILDSCFHTLSTPASYDKAVVEVLDGGHSPMPTRQIPYPFSLLEGGL